MNTQDRAVVKALLQNMTDKYLTGSDEFRAALKHFNITTTSYHSHEGFTKTKHVVIVFTPDRIDRCPHGFHVEFASREEAEAYEAAQRATGDVEIKEDAATARAVIAQAIHAGANSFGGVIGEHEDLVETLRNAGYLTAAHKVDAVYDTLDTSNHKTMRKSWLEALRDVSAAL